MKNRRSHASGGVGTLLVVIGSVLLLAGSCSSGRPAAQPGVGAPEPEPLRERCESTMLYLGRLIAARSLEPDFPPAILLEAKELYQAGMELYLEGDYDLALELVEEGIELVKEQSG